MEAIEATGVGDSRTLLRDALKSLDTLWDESRSVARRDSFGADDEISDERFPSATAHTLIALGRCGVLDDDRTIRDLFAGGVNPWRSLEVETVATRFFATNGGSGDWVDGWAASSTHGSTGPRKLLVLSLVAQASEQLVAALSRTKQWQSEWLERLSEPVVGGAMSIRSSVADALPTDNTELARLSELPAYRPFVLLQALHALDSADAISKLVGATPDDPGADLRAHLLGAFRRHVDRELARSTTASHPDLDVPGLLFSFAGLVRLDSRELLKPIAEAVIRTVVQAQREDGCWSEGAAIVSRPGTDVLQQSSIEVALELAQLVRSQDALVGVIPSYERLVEPILVSVSRTLDYCTRTFQAECGNPPCFSGWASDRSRWPGVAEAWIAALIARLAHESDHIDRGVRRQRLLHKYAADALASAGPLSQDAFFEQTIEPDSSLRTIGLIWDKVIGPVLACPNEHSLTLPPGSRSLILAGPPGSGKTYFVRRIASALGWPVIVLGPGTFITRGLERIEETASEVFRDLDSLEAAVVLLDECDELFLKRSTGGSGDNRTILSFATASMLPKLQDLYDRGQIITILATNYIQRIDPAIRRPGRFDHRLLFDRPDDLGRRAYASDVLGLGPDESTDLASRTIGCTFKDMDGFGKRGVLLETSAPEYARWIATDGPAELEGCGGSSEGRLGVITRWIEVLKVAGKGLDGTVQSDGMAALETTIQRLNDQGGAE